ncbi:Crp/Fnr family transcriptional regulator [soil metagenome]
MNKLIQFLDAIRPLSDPLKDHLSVIVETKALSRKEYLLKKGRISSEVCFIEKGLLRCFYLKEDKEVCSWFMMEGDVIVSVESFFKQQVSHETIQALEDCILHSFNYDDLQKTYDTYPELNYHARLLTEKYYTLSEQRLYSLRMQRAHGRYEYLINNFPEIIQRVPSKYIASYLSITEETLSRIRSRH